MAKQTAPCPEPLIRRHPKDAENGLARFRRAAGSLPVSGPLPSKNFLEDRAERELSERASD